MELTKQGLHVSEGNKIKWAIYPLINSQWIRYIMVFSVTFKKTILDLSQKLIFLNLARKDDQTDNAKVARSTSLQVIQTSRFASSSLHLNLPKYTMTRNDQERTSLNDYEWITRYIIYISYICNLILSSNIWIYWYFMHMSLILHLSVCSS